ncbi:MAG: Transrane efflux protein [Frankiales bacterium]|nr:Transrane efflux protein [Frankiales bacterium]
MLDAMQEVRTTGLRADRWTLPEPPPRRTPEQSRTLVLASLSTLLVLMSFVTPLGTAARTAADVGGGAGSVPWLLSAMALGLAVSLLPSGAFADDLGRRRVLVVGLTLLALGSVLCAVAGSSTAFVAGRLLSGLGAGAVLACGLGLIGHAFPPGPARGHATGVWGASVGAGIGTGGLLTVVVDQGTSWRHTYVVVAVLAVVLAVAGRLLLVESTADVRRRPDLLGAALLGTGLAALLAALVEVREGVTAEVVGLVLSGALLVGGFVLAENRVSAPMLDLALLRRRPFLAASVGSFTNGAGATALAAFTPTLVQRGLGRSLLAASVLVLLFAGTSVATALPVKRLPATWTSRRLLVGGLLGVAVGQLAQTGLTVDCSLARLVPGTLVVGVAFGVLNATLGREAVASVPADRSALGSGANNTFRYVGSALGISLVAVIATRAPGADGLVAGWTTAGLVTAGLSVLGALVVLALRPLPVAVEPAQPRPSQASTSSASSSPTTRWPSGE